MHGTDARVSKRFDRHRLFAPATKADVGSGTNIDLAGLTLTATILRIARVRADTLVKLMTPARRSRRLRSARNNSIALPYTAAAVAIGALIASALFNQSRAKKAEQDNPPIGKFINVDGVRLHYIEHGSGEPLVLLHGNVSMIQDFESSGLIDLAAQNFRVIVFDRPGFGHSDRPRNVVWTPDAQAQLIKRALDQLGVSHAIVLGHSWGASVAVAMGLKFPDMIRGLVLASGYYYPTLRPDVVAMSTPAVPGVGDILGSTLSPIISRLMWPLMISNLFSPAEVPRKFERFPKEMALRPSQLRASAAESGLMIPDAFHFRNRYRDLKMPVVIIAGENDKLVNIDEQSARLHSEITQSKFHRIAAAGHMIHQTGTRQVMSAINEAESSARSA
ncbi:MAG: alpha/beta hydrolase [Pseudomonadota bacterium]